MSRRLLSGTFALILAIACGCTIASEAQTSDAHDLRFPVLPRVWDEGLPLGNGMVGALVWQRENVVRMALDRADLWDLRHVKELAFLDWLWLCKPVSEKWTRAYFGTGGLNVPGVATLEGEPMGGWIQYSLSPTTGA